MPRNLTPEDRWETDFEVPIPGEPRRIGPLETLFQRLLNRTERLKGRIGAILGLPWDATPPDTLAGLAGRVSTLETSQGGTNLSAHRSATTLDHPDGSVTAAKLAPGSVVDHLGYTPVNKAGDTMLGGFTIQPNFSQVLNLKGGLSDHVYMAFYARSADQNARSGYIGYPEAGSNQLTITNEIGENVVINNTLLSRYDHQNRFVVQSYLSNAISVSPNSEHPIAITRILVPSEKALYLRRVRWDTYNSFQFRPRVTSQFTWTGSVSAGDVAIDQLMSNSTLAIVYLVIANITSNIQSIPTGFGIWAEFEIR